MIAVHLARKDLIVVVLARERLHDAHADDVFVEHGVDPAHGRTHLAITIARAAAKNFGRDKHQRQDKKTEQGELPIEREHRKRRAEDVKEIAEDGDDCPRD